MEHINTSRVMCEGGHRVNINTINSNSDSSVIVTVLIDTSLNDRWEQETLY